MAKFLQTAVEQARSKSNRNCLIGYLGVVNQIGTYIANSQSERLQKIKGSIHWTDFVQDYLASVMEIESPKRDDVFKLANPNRSDSAEHNILSKLLESNNMAQELNNALKKMTNNHYNNDDEEEEDERLDQELNFDAENEKEEEDEEPIGTSTDDYNSTVNRTGVEKQSQIIIERLEDDDVKLEESAEEKRDEPKPKSEEVAPNGPQPTETAPVEAEAPKIEEKAEEPKSEVSQPESEDKVSLSPVETGQESEEPKEQAPAPSKEEELKEQPPAPVEPVQNQPEEPATV